MLARATGSHEKPLAGLKVVDFSRVLAGPYCSMLLADMGADVVKIELPGQGDPLRMQGPPFFHGMGLTFLSANRNKRSLTLDMQKTEGKALAYELCMRADVVLENFRPDVMSRLGLGYERVSVGNPTVVYASISGFGSDGPDRLQGAFDLTIQAIGGYMSITGERDGKPIKLGTSAFDVIAGMNCHAAVLAALIQRSVTGKGQKVETSLLDSEIAFLGEAALAYLMKGINPQKWGSEHAHLVPSKAFRTADAWVVIHAALNAQFDALAKVLQRSDLLNDLRFTDLERRVTNRQCLYEILDDEISKYSTADLLALLEAGDVPCAPVNTMEEVCRHPQVQDRAMLRQVNHPEYGELPQVGAAVKYSGFDINADWTAPPLLGEHRVEILREWLSLSDHEIDALHDACVI